MSNAKKKFYAVKVGKVPGIYNTWPECQEQVSGFSGAEYKSFNTKEAAQQYIDETIVEVSNNTDDELDYEKLVNDDLKEGYVVAFTDGSHNIKSNKSSYGIHISIPNEDGLMRIEKVGNKVTTDKFSKSNNIVGEVFGVINALDWCLKNEFDKVSIYCDYEGLIQWQNGNWKANKEIAKFYVEKMEEYSVMIDIKFTWVKGHSNVPQNEAADLLARNSLKNNQQNFKTGKNYFKGYVLDIAEVDKVISNIETNIQINIEETEVNNGIKKTLSYEKEKLHVTFYPSKGTMLVQGAPGYLFSMMLSYYTETLETFKIVKTYSDAFESTIQFEFVRDKINDLNLPDNYPESYKTLIKQAISSLKIKDLNEYDYSHYTVPAYRALEGNLRYLFEEAEKHIDERFSIGGHFDIDSNGKYFLKTRVLKEHHYSNKIEECYNHYFYERHPQMHTGEIGIIDQTKLISTLQDAKDEISEILDIIRF